ncbi:OLC1v1022862C1 [Oldenlandia corymbosa var. corymbosa]|uniref:OLC1v1022862C1 n=1 Tax=Oldenlandia corymbosa var. corymbosa TaxID=529605 RepID=A0AAV1BYQ3_OLDCO|nr:OLC1v1022862C1 [Oldenlandia corymbosa var. corymbosa]
MARAANLSGIFEALSVIPKLQQVENIRNRSTSVNLLSKKKDENEEIPFQATRRLAMGLTSLALFSTAVTGVSHADDNGYWLDGPLPVPTAKNKITNEETGTRSFLKTGLYVANIGGPKNRMHRLRRYAFDLLAMADLIGPDTLTYVRRYLKYKSTIMYFDFDELISAVPVSDKQPLTDLANRLFDNFEVLLDAVKSNNLPQTQTVYKDTEVILNEVMARMA